jgi:hypothetical protein
VPIPCATTLVILSERSESKDLHLPHSRIQPELPKLPKYDFFNSRSILAMHFASALDKLILMSGANSLKERMRLEAFYAEKNDEELLVLLADYQALTEVAQGALHDELNKRVLWSDNPNREPDTSGTTVKDREALSELLRKGGFLLLNLIAAVFGTATVESPFDHLYHPHTIKAVLFKADLLSAVFSFTLGFFVFRRWKPVAAKWVGL